MCGIVGCFGHGDRSVLERMNELQRHRGPDDDGVEEVRGRGGLGATRLAIIDVAGGHQPVTSIDGDVTAVLNGEIYNHPSLQRELQSRGHQLRSRCDIEALIHLYEEYGEALVHALEGMYAFALWDRRRRKVIVARDRFGEKPLFFHCSGGTLVFASELQALLAGLPQRPGLRPEAIDAFLVWGYIPNSLCIYEGVQQLRPGQMLAWTEGTDEPRLETYWRPPTAQPAAAPQVEALVDETAWLLDQAVRRRLIADVPLGVMLSGGLDSSLVTALASQATPRLKTFTVGYDVGTVSEAGHARRVAEILGTDHHELILSEAELRDSVLGLLQRLDQPIGDQATVALHSICRFARQTVTVALGGEGADELFAGYPRYRWLGTGMALQRRLPKPLLRRAENVLTQVQLPGRLRRLKELAATGDLAAKQLEWVTDGRLTAIRALRGPRLAESPIDVEVTAGSRELDAADRPVEWLMHVDLGQWLPDDVLTKADRASMQTSLEMRAPFLDRALAELALSVPSEIHLRSGGKYLLKRVMKARFPELGQPRRKTAFRVPASAWLRGPLLAPLREQLASSALYREGWLDRREAERLIDEHAAGTADHSGILWIALTLGEWIEAQTYSDRAVA